MEGNKEEEIRHNLNITLKQSEEEKKDEIIISFSGIWKQLKRLVVIWLVIAIIIGILVPVYQALFTADQYKNLTALVSFNYDGIEKGLAPDGSSFDVTTIKNPTVIESALTTLGRDVTQLENIRQGITIEGVIPSDAIDAITVYKSVYEQGNLNAGEKMLETSYFPTQYKITFDYSKTDFSGTEAVEVLNTMLDCYHDYFFETYGFNKALGSALTALDYTDYDYAEAVDVFCSTLTMMQEYIATLSEEDTTRFRSTVTGYSFSDLEESIRIIQDVDLDLISSYVTVNTVTKDKDALLDYYNYRIESLTYELNVTKDKLDALTDSINNYEKDTIIIYSENQDTSEYSQSSAAYDSLITQKIKVQETYSQYNEEISQIRSRISTLKSAKTTASQTKIEKVESDFEALAVKVNELIEKVNETSNEYYETVYLANAYGVLVPATSSGLRTTKSVISSSIEPLLILEGVLLVIYLAAAFVIALVVENRKKQQAAMDIGTVSPERTEAETEEAETKEADKDEQDTQEIDIRI